MAKKTNNMDFTYFKAINDLVKYEKYQYLQNKYSQSLKILPGVFFRP